MGGLFFIQDFRSNDFIQTASQIENTLQVNTYHVTNKNIAPSKVTDERRRKRGCLPGHPQA